jgi:hypothetical protein
VRARSASLAAFLLVGWTTRAASADETGEVGLSVEAPPSSECVTAEALRADVQDRVGSVRVTGSPAADRRIDVRIAALPRAFSATIRAVDVQGRTLGERYLSSAGLDCRALDRPLLLVISTLIGITGEEAPSRGAEEEPEEREWPARPLAPEDPAADTDTSAVVPAAPPAPAEPFRFGLSLTGGAQTAFLPGVTPLGSLRFLARRGWLEFRIGVGATPSAVRDLGGSARATFRGLFGDADVCALTSATSGTEFAFCAGVRAGAVHGKTTGLYENADTVRPFAQVTPRASFRAALAKHHALVFELGGAIPLFPQTYVFVEADGLTHRVHAVDLGVFAEAGWIWRFSS